MNRSLGFAKGMRQQHSGFLQDAAHLLTVGCEQRTDHELMRFTGQKGAKLPDRNFSQGRPNPNLSQKGQAYQSSLLTRYIKQPSMPSSHSIHSALGNERSNGWPTLGPVR